MNRRLHLALALLLGLALDFAGTWLLSSLWPAAEDSYTVLGLGILWGVTVGVSVVAYWEEVIDR